jgi:hypothetical protein
MVETLLPIKYVFRDGYGAVAVAPGILVLLRLRDMFISAINLVGYSMYSSLITVGFGTGE